MSALIAGLSACGGASEAETLPSEPDAGAVETTSEGGYAGGSSALLRSNGTDVCIGINSGDVVSGDGYMNSAGNYFWDPLDLESEVEHDGLGGISAFGNDVSLYFWPSLDEATQVYEDAKQAQIEDVTQIGNAVVVGLDSLDVQERDVVMGCLTE